MGSSERKIKRRLRIKGASFVLVGNWVPARPSAGFASGKKAETNSATSRAKNQSIEMADHRVRPGRVPLDNRPPQAGCGGKLMESGARSEARCV
jgi:hypothetical protein